MSDQHKQQHHMAEAIRFSWREVRQAMREVQGVNAKLAILITQGVGTMWTAYAFAALALVSFSQAFRAFIHGDTVTGVAWLSQTFFQLVLLPIIIVGQNLLGATADARADKTFQDTEKIIDALDTQTQGGLTDVLEAVEALPAKLRDQGRSAR